MIYKLRNPFSWYSNGKQSSAIKCDGQKSTRSLILHMQFNSWTRITTMSCMLNVREGCYSITKDQNWNEGSGLLVVVFD